MKRNSAALETLSKLNEEQRFSCYLNESMNLGKQCNTKKQFDYFNVDRFLEERIKDHPNYYRDVVISFMNATNEYREYKSKVNKIVLGNSSESPLFNYFERKEFDKQVIEYKDPCIIDVCYTSPAGRNSYSRRIGITAEYLKCRYESVVNEEKRKLTKEYQRSLLTPSLRYEILKRDNFSCCICGRTCDDGVKLHVDHIIPVAKGGKTVRENLRTLCDECNLGKSDKYDPNGLN